MPIKYKEFSEFKPRKSIQNVIILTRVLNDLDVKKKN